MAEDNIDAGGIKVTPTNLESWKRDNHEGIKFEQYGATFILKDSATGIKLTKEALDRPEEFHALTFVFSADGSVAGIAGQLGAKKYLLMPDTDADGKRILRVSRGYHRIYKSGNDFYGEYGTSTEKIS